jgi:hypothetical protein
MIGTCFPRVYVAHVPNGAHLAGSATARFKQAGALKGDGMKPGFPDLVCLWSVAKGCFLEVKRPKTGKLTEDQKKAHEIIRLTGWPCQVVTSTEDAYLFLRELGAPWSGIVWGDC